MGAGAADDTDPRADCLGPRRPGAGPTPAGPRPPQPGSVTCGHNAGTEFLANFVDLGRPPIVGLIEPEWELRSLTAELAGLDELTGVS